MKEQELEQDLLKKAFQIHGILNKRGGVETSNKMIHTKDEVVAKTTLTHSKAADLLKLLSTYGFIKFVEMIEMQKIGLKCRSNFYFHFNLKPENIVQSIKEDIKLSLDALQTNLSRLGVYAGEPERQAAVDSILKADFMKASKPKRSPKKAKEVIETVKEESNGNAEAESTTTEE